jgi:nucleoid-associated protein EbfC
MNKMRKVMNFNNLNIDKDTLNDLMKTAQEMQKKMQGIQQDLSNTEVTGEAGGGFVKIIMNGRFVAKRIFLDPSLLKENKQVIEDLIIAGINDATRKVEKLSQDKLLSMSKQAIPSDVSGSKGTGTAEK